MKSPSPPKEKIEKGAKFGSPHLVFFVNIAWQCRLLFLDSLMMDLKFLGRNFSKRDLNQGRSVSRLEITLCINSTLRC